jgi:hypothetical protein
VSTVVNLVAGILLAFALLALAAMAFLVGGAVRLEVLRSERRSGQLRALGWTVRGLRTALLAERIPVLVIGASAGSAVGYFVGPKLVEPLTDLYGAYPAPWRPLLVAFAVGAVVVLVASGMVIWCTRHLGKRAVSAQLKALSADRPARLLGRSQLGGAVARFGLAAVAGRKRRAAAVALVTLLASTVVVSGAVIYGAVAQVTHDPAMWGFHYDYRVQLPSGTSLLTAFEQVSALPGVKVASVALSGDAMLSPPTGPTVPFELVSSPSMVQPPVVAGGAAQGGLEVEIGKQVANEMGAKPGSVLQIGPGWWAGLPEQEVPVRVAGVVQDIEDNGNILLGSTYLVGDLGGDVSSEGVLVRCAAASTCPAVGQELASVSRGAWAITSARAGTVLPFAASVEDVSLALSLAFALLACAGSLFSGLVTSAEMAPAYGLLRAIGAKPRQLVATVAVQVGVMAGPALVVGLCAGFPLAHLALAQATKSIGGLRMGTPFGLLALGLLVVAAASGLGLGVPLARAAMRQPVRSIGLDR